MNIIVFMTDCGMVDYRITATKIERDICMRNRNMENILFTGQMYKIGNGYTIVYNKQSPALPNNLVLCEREKTFIEQEFKE